MNMRIGEVARAAGTTVRTIRYYEEIGLLPAEPERASGSHRLYTEQDVERLTDILRLRDLLGVSLEELRTLVAARDASSVLRDEFHADGTSTRRRAAILREALSHIERQRELVARRRRQLDELDNELSERQSLVLTRLDELGAPAAPRARRAAG